MNGVSTKKKRINSQYAAPTDSPEARPNSSPGAGILHVGVARHASTMDKIIDDKASFMIPEE